MDPDKEKGKTAGLRGLDREFDVFCLDRLASSVLGQPVGFPGQFSDVGLCFGNKCSSSIAANPLSTILLCDTLLIIAYFSSSILMVLVSRAVLTRAKYTPLATPLPVSSRPSQRSLWFPPASFPL